MSVDQKRRSTTMAITNRELAAGTVLVGKYKQTERRLKVLGEASFELDDGKTFKSLSAAGSAVMGGQSCNGWRFWTVEGEVPAPTEPSEKETKATKPQASAK